ncbi:MAG: LytR/AlgR family response regulator transcription factor [Polaribacter sp.]
MRIIIVEDEILLVNSLKNILSAECPFIEVVGVSDSVKEGTLLIAQEKPDLLLMDIELIDGNAFKLLDNLKTLNLQFKIIFITAYNEFAIKAFKYSAVNYLLKPIDRLELVETLQKLKTETTTNIDVLQSNYKELTKLLLKTQQSIHVVEIKDIIYCKSEGNYTIFYLKNKQEIVITKPIKHYEELLSNVGFCRVHQSYLININAVNTYLKNGFAVLSNQAEIPIATRRKEHFLKTLQNI